MFYIIFFLLIVLRPSFAQVTSEESLQAATILGKWLSQSTSHYDFLSATPVATLRSGDSFFVVGAANIQMASEYGYSYRKVPRNDSVTQAYQTLGVDTSGLAPTFDVSRYHLNLGFANKHDFNFSYLNSSTGIAGWGLGYKIVLQQDDRFFYSFRTQYSESSLDAFFQTKVLANDFSMAVHFQLFDFFAGLRHSMGWVNFESSTPALKIPEITYFSDLSEIEYFYGVVISTTLNSRTTIQINQLGADQTLTGKFSFHFDSLIPTYNNWFKDPRAIRR